ncbi:peroxiredoxin-like family protein [Plebeiibacterium sediminum]|uniref:thioredoxin-dependent peroxiredoxin n=1 Tax=Plebeiibacterium sediminum TaxID=2992112 RepID=A0AAE3SIQ9_9BACT|nr:peroxiredoxin-like family protein [Plebeiobacterium sediminum]MCW3789498.1 AhpC/TSA family protein [Plebeiobacterium sediminum]
MTKIYYILLISTLISCSISNNKEKETEEKVISSEENSLASDLNKRKEAFSAKASDYTKKIYAEGIQSIVNDNVVENALQVGDTAINFTLKNALNKDITLYDKLKDGPVILMWYRGGWCPYCNLTLNHMQASLPEFKQYNANLLALTPELPDSTLSTQDKNALKFDVLSDIDNKVAGQYKVVFNLTSDVADAYEQNFGLSKYNGNSSAQLPLAATYIIGTDKVIKYAFLDADYRNRAEPKEIISVLKTL